MMQTPSPHRNLLVGLFFLAAFLVLGVMAYDRYRKAHTPPPPAQPGPTPSRIVSLFFPDPEWDHLEREGRELERCEDLTACLRELLIELRNGPIGDLDPVFPDGGDIPGVHVVGEVATIDLPSDFVAAVEGGSAGERLTLYALVNSVTASFPEIRGVRFLVEGKGVETLHGHLDLREPLAFDPALVRDESSDAAETSKESK